MLIAWGCHTQFFRRRKAGRPITNFKTAIRMSLGVSMKSCRRSDEKISFMPPRCSPLSWQSTRPKRNEIGQEMNELHRFPQARFFRVACCSQFTKIENFSGPDGKHKKLLPKSSTCLSFFISPRHRSGGQSCKCRCTDQQESRKVGSTERGGRALDRKTYSWQGGRFI